jgi:predicted nucleic acid-binding protein
VRPAATSRWLLLDKSALVREPDLDPELGEPCLCAITRFELLYSARSPRAFERLEADIDSFHELRVDAETIAIARTAQRELGTKSQHRVPIPDLLIAACAHQHQAAVLHLDRHYDALARVLAFTPVRLDGCVSAQLRMLTARATTITASASEIADCTSMSIFAQRLSGIASVGLNAVAFVNET